MEPEELKNRNFEKEFIFSSSRSGGPGGQNVNKVSTKVELRFNLSDSTFFSDIEKEIIFRKLKNKINKVNEIVLVSQSGRTQLTNKEDVVEKFYKIVSKALTTDAERKATAPTVTSRIRRLSSKRIHSNVKRLRKDKGVDED